MTTPHTSDPQTANGITARNPPLGIAKLKAQALMAVSGLHGRITNVMARRAASATSHDPLERSERALQNRLMAAVGAIGAMLIVTAGWVAQASLSSAVIGSGLVVVDTSAKKVQHPTGGIVASIRVKNGDRVSAGDIVLTLDDTQARANLGLVTSQLVQLVGRKSRLRAEQDGVPEIRFPVNFLHSDIEAPAVMAAELQLFQTRRIQRVGQQDQLRQRIGQYNKEIEGLGAQLAAKEKEIKLLEDDLSRMRDMFKRQLVPSTRVLQAERDMARLEGERGQLIAQIARSGGQISEAELQIVGIDQGVQSDAGKELRDVEAKINELLERKLSAEDQLKRVEVRAPQSGIVHELTVFTVGGVINAGETVMMIVPTEELLALEVKVSPNDIDQVSLGRRATLRFPSLSRGETPEIIGEVTRVAADLTREQQSGAAYFLVRMTAKGTEEEKLRAIKLVPGMPVEAHIEGGQRTALSYLVKPVSDQIRRAFREE